MAAARKNVCFNTKLRHVPARGKYKQGYDMHQLTAAVLLARQTIVRYAAEKYEVPKSTVGDYLKRGMPWLMELSLQKTNGSKTRILHRRPNRMVHTKFEEERLARFIADCANHNLALTPGQVKGYVMKLVTRAPRRNPAIKRWLRNGAPSRKWFRGFMARHPHLSSRFSDPRDHKRQQVTKEDLDTLYDLLEKVHSEFPAKYGTDLTADRVYNLDETNFRPSAHSRVITIKGTNNNKTMGNANRDSITILPCIRADGMQLPALIVPKGAGKTPDWWGPRMAPVLKGTSGEQARCFSQGNAYMTTDLFYEWFKSVFLPYTAQQRKTSPVVLLFDNFNAHVDIDVLELATNNNVVVIGFPPHSTHITQPLDRGVMQPLKAAYRKAHEAWRCKSVEVEVDAHGLPVDPNAKGVGSIQAKPCVLQRGTTSRKVEVNLNMFMVINVKEIVEILYVPQVDGQPAAWDAGVSSKNILDGFAKSGVWPINRHAVADEYAKCPSLHALKEELKQLQDAVDAARAEEAAANTVTSNEAAHQSQPNLLDILANAALAEASLQDVAEEAEAVHEAEHDAHGDADDDSDVDTLSVTSDHEEDDDTCASTDLPDEPSLEESTAACDALFVVPGTNTLQLQRLLENRAQRDNGAKLLTAAEHLQQLRQQKAKKAAEEAEKQARQQQRKEKQEENKRKREETKRQAELRKAQQAEKRAHREAAQAEKRATAAHKRATQAAADPKPKRRRRTITNEPDTNDQMQIDTMHVTGVAVEVDT